jgi:hypothetical protein
MDVDLSSGLVHKSYDFLTWQKEINKGSLGFSPHLENLNWIYFRSHATTGFSSGYISLWII